MATATGGTDFPVKRLITPQGVLTDLAQSWSKLVGKRHIYFR